MTGDDKPVTELDPMGPASMTELPTAMSVQRFQLAVVEGVNAGTTWTSSGGGASVGSHPSNDVVLEDPTVSRFHFEVALDGQRAKISDLGSRNGTVVDGVHVEKAWLRDGSVIRAGRTTISFAFEAASEAVRLWPHETFGTMVGRSVQMRALFAEMARAAGASATVLLQGETGTGKEEAAVSIHQESSRAEGPFAVVDCGVIRGSLLESELFGHERGAFTGADRRRAGAFLAANGGTVFLDEIGELPLELQPKVLRVLEDRSVKRLGGTQYESLDVRIIAATNRQLRTEVNEGRFRPDLYYRLAVLNLTIPPLRERPDDIPMLAGLILEGLGADATTRGELLTPEFTRALQCGAWPGNVRELRNYLERCLAFNEALPLPSARFSPPSSGGAVLAIDPRVSFAESRKRAVDEFERHYLEALVQLHGGNVSKAAREAGLSRGHLHRLLSRHRAARLDDDDAQ